MESIFRIVLPVLGGLLLSASVLIQPVSLRCEYLKSPRGIDMQDPRFFWKLQSSDNDQRQTAYPLLVASSEAVLEKDKGDQFDSGKVTFSETTQIICAGKKLESASDYFWKVKVWGQDGEPTVSPVATFSTGLFAEAEWSGAEGIS